MTVHAVMIVRNEIGRYLSQALQSAATVARVGGGQLIVTDDASTDKTMAVALNYTTHVQSTPEPLFWEHEGRARQRHLDYAARWIAPGDWVLSLDADETINRPELVGPLTESASPIQDAIGVPLYEFWEPDQYRVDGQWFGTMSSRLFRWHDGAAIADKAMACGSEPSYVGQAVRLGRWMQQTDVHLLHWGYLKKADRDRKYLAYTSRPGGHGHGNQHVNSIIGQPQLRRYP